MGKSIIVIDCQNDFITGNLACFNGKEAIGKIIKFINTNKHLEVFYSCDYHSVNNKSFKENGGQWAKHCIKNSKGAEIYNSFYTDIENCNQSPLNDNNIFYKGVDNNVEEYSAFKATNKDGKMLCLNLKRNVIICGVSLEYCVKETAIELLNHGFNVYLYLEGIGYIYKSDCENVLNELQSMGVKVM